jgi:hypothetical protein
MNLCEKHTNVYGKQDEDKVCTLASGSNDHKAEVKENEDTPKRIATESVQAELLAGLINGFVISIQSGMQPRFTASSDQKSFVFGSSPNGKFNACIDGFIYGATEDHDLAIFEVKRSKRPRWTDLTTQHRTASHDQVRRQETAEIAALAYEHRAKFRKIATENEKGCATQLLFSLDEREFHLTIAEMPIKWLDYISSCESRVWTRGLNTMEDMLRLTEYGPAYLDHTLHIKEIMLILALLVAKHLEPN